MFTVFVVSDASGETVERLVRAALAQFDAAEIEVVRRGRVRTRRQVEALIAEATGRHALVVHTLVSDRLRREMVAAARRHGVDCLDALGPVLDRLATHLRLSPKQKPGLFRQLREDKSRQIAAVAFAFHHDDGQNAAELDRAEVVLVGVSRTMKTPTTLYLAYRGWFAANVPLVPELPLPPGLLAVAPQRVFCLLTSPEQLQQMRRVRAKEEAIPMQGYASSAQVRHELAYSEALCRRHGWQPIDCAGKSVEEVAQEIILLLSES